MLQRIKELAYDTVTKKLIARDPSGKKITVPLGGAKSIDEVRYSYSTLTLPANNSGVQGVDFTDANDTPLNPGLEFSDGQFVFVDSGLWIVTPVVYPKSIPVPEGAVISLEAYPASAILRAGDPSTLFASGCFASWFNAEDALAVNANSIGLSATFDVYAEIRFAKVG